MCWCMFLLSSCKNTNVLLSSPLLGSWCCIIPLSVLCKWLISIISWKMFFFKKNFNWNHSCTTSSVIYHAYIHFGHSCLETFTRHWRLGYVLGCWNWEWIAIMQWHIMTKKDYNSFQSVTLLEADYMTLLSWLIDEVCSCQNGDVQSCTLLFPTKNHSQPVFQAKAYHYWMA